MQYRRLALASSALLTFIFSLQILSEATSVLTPVLENYLKLVVRNDVSALGAGWISSYILLNGSTVAAMGLAFLENNLISTTQYFLIAAGSRLGAAFIVILIGAMEYLRGKNESIMDSMSIGVLSFLITYSIYLPATLAGYLLIDSIDLGTGTGLEGSGILSVFKPLAGTLIELSGPEAGFLISFGLLFLSLKKFDAAFSGLGKKQIRNNYVRYLLTNKWLSLLAGALITLVTLSVSLSLGLIVPLYNQGYIKREEIIPYIMGANITTLGDTLLAASVVGTSAGTEAVITLGLTASVLTLTMMILYRGYLRALKYTFDRIQTDRRFLTAFGILMILLPFSLSLI